MNSQLSSKSSGTIFLINDPCNSKLYVFSAMLGKVCISL